MTGTPRRVPVAAAYREVLDMLELRPAADRGLAKLGWLHSRHSFSFGSYYNPEQAGFSRR